MLRRYFFFSVTCSSCVMLSATDLRVLGKSDFKRLLNWRIKLRAKLREAAGIKGEEEVRLLSKFH